jgi:hypothetical protein
MSGEQYTPGQRPFFIPMRANGYNEAVDKSYAAAKAEAVRIFNLRGIQTKIEFLRPVHLGYTTTGSTIYTMPGSQNNTFTLKSNVALMPWGVINQDPTWYSLKWYEGAATKYIGDWFTRPVYFFTEQEGAWGGMLEPYNFRGDQTLTFYCVSNTSSNRIQGWILAFVVLPTTLEETSIITT